MYQVWTKAQYDDRWELTECPDIAAVELIIRDNFGKEVEVKVSMPVEYCAKIAVKVHAPEGKKSVAEQYVTSIEKSVKEFTGETTKSEAEPDKDTGGKGHGKVR